jgi:L-2-hydroxyglutarate oxidase LhgO
LTAPAGETTIAERGKGRFPRQILRSEADMDKVDCVVVGAGVIGLAIARRLAQAGREVIVLEAAEGIGTITSSRNSEVIHAGIYYRAGSLMARMCVSGKHALYR